MAKGNGKFSSRQKKAGPVKIFTTTEIREYQDQPRDFRSLKGWTTNPGLARHCGFWRKRFTLYQAYEIVGC